MPNNHDLERAYVGKLYSGPKWKKRVKQMNDSQILAIYMRERQKASKKKPKESKPDDEPF